MEWLVVGTVALTVIALVGYRFTRKKLEIEISSVGIDISSVPIKANSRTIMMIIISLAVLFSSLYIILSGDYDEGSQKWAFGSVGSIIGFWLRPEEKTVS